MSLTKDIPNHQLYPYTLWQIKSLFRSWGRTRVYRSRVVAKLSKYCAANHVHLDQVTNSCTMCPWAHERSHGYSHPISVFNFASLPSLYSCSCSPAPLLQTNSPLLLSLCFHPLFLILLTFFTLKKMSLGFFDFNFWYSISIWLPFLVTSEIKPCKSQIKLWGPGPGT